MTDLSPLWTLRAAGVFVAALVMDAVWALYIRRTTEGRAVAAANYAMGIMAFGAINTLAYIKQPVLLLPILAGNWLGTYLIVRHDHQTETP